jgi:3-dehydroquinate dehydratase
MNYEKAYHILFNAMTDAVNILISQKHTPDAKEVVITNHERKVIDTIQKAQEDTEKMFMESGDTAE